MSGDKLPIVERLEKLKAERDQFMENACDAGQKMIILANHGDLALSLIPSTVATITELVSALREARAALHQHYVDWDGEPEDAVPLQLARGRIDTALSNTRGDTREQS